MKRLLWCIGLAMTPWLLGCHAIAGTGDFEFTPIVGSWVSVRTIDGNHNRMDIIGDGSGMGTFYVLGDGDLREERKVQIKWGYLGDLFGLDVTCIDENCGGGDEQSFRATCSYEKPRDRLACEAEDKAEIAPSELEFKRVEDGH